VKIKKRTTYSEHQSWVRSEFKNAVAIMRDAEMFQTAWARNCGSHFATVTEVGPTEWHIEVGTTCRDYQPSLEQLCGSVLDIVRCESDYLIAENISENTVCVSGREPLDTE
jgi:hypothetical protein